MITDRYFDEFDEYASAYPNLTDEELFGILITNVEPDVYNDDLLDFMCESNIDNDVRESMEYVFECFTREPTLRVSSLFDLLRMAESEYIHTKAYKYCFLN